MADLKTDYTDDVLNEHMNGKRRFKITHSDGTEEMVTIEDASSYLQTGSTYGAADVNKTNQRVNEHSKNLTASNGTPFRFAVDENGKYGYIVTDSEGADTFSPFKKGDLRISLVDINNANGLHISTEGYSTLKIEKVANKSGTNAVSIYAINKDGSEGDKIDSFSLVTSVASKENLSYDVSLYSEVRIKCTASGVTVTELILT